MTEDTRWKVAHDGRSVRATLGRTTIRVHRHIDYERDQWLLSCVPFCDCLKLIAKPLKHACAEALGRVQREADDMLADAKTLAETIGELPSQEG